MIRKVVGVFYSPAGTAAKMTRQATDEIAKMLKEHCPEDIGMELCDISCGTGIPEITSESVVILGMPIQLGKVPLSGVKAMKKISGADAMTILIAPYIGRHYGDALHELGIYAEDRGFNVVAAGAFAYDEDTYLNGIGEANDALKEYIAAASAKIKRLGGCDIDGLKVKPAPLEIPGRVHMRKIGIISSKFANVAENMLAMIFRGKRESEWFL